MAWVDFLVTYHTDKNQRSKVRGLCKAIGMYLFAGGGGGGVSAGFLRLRIKGLIFNRHLLKG